MTDPRRHPDEEHRLHDEDERRLRERRSITDVEREITAERELPPDRRYRHRAIEHPSSPPPRARESRLAEYADRAPPDRPAPDPGHAADRAAPMDIEALRRTAAERHLVREHAVQEPDSVAPRGLVIASRVVSLVFSVIYALLGLRLLLGILAANPNATFAQWIARASEPLHAPFRGLFPNVTIEDGFTFALSVAFAILVYALIHALIHALIQGLLRIAGPRVA